MSFSENFPFNAPANPSTDGQSNHVTLDSFDQLPVEEIVLTLLSSGHFRRGSGTDPAHVQMIAETATFSELPPILVQEKNFRIIDGMHRFEAAKLRNERTIRARIINCTDNDAFIAAVKANTLHGLPLSRADRALSAQRILDWHPDWSDRAIGIATGLSAKTIASLRQLSAEDTQQFAKRLGRDGKRRPVTACEGRRRAAEFIAARPDASLREVARETDVSLGTVQDVRARMRRGLDPLATGRTTAAPKAPERPDNGPDSTLPLPLPLPSKLTLRGGHRETERPSWPEVSGKLMCDPSLKYTEGGRAFMRWMMRHISDVDQWKEFVDSVPAHWHDEISSVAERASEDWRAFADYLKTRQAGVV